MDKDILIKILGRKISDGRFLNLIKKILNAGYYEFREVKTDIAGVPQGNIISPILSNIYLHELDSFMEELKQKYDSGKKRRLTRHYADTMLKKGKARREGRLGDLRALHNEQRKEPAADPMDPKYRRLNYIRYADDFLIGIAGPKSEAQAIKNQVKEFLKNNLKLDLHEDKTKITNAADEPALFLGVHIQCPRYEEEKVINVTRNGKTFRSRKTSANIRMMMPRERILKKLQEYSFIDRNLKPIPKFA